jgi:hypothetical protein
VLPSTGERIAVPDDPDDEDEAFVAATETHPALRARAERIQQQRASGARGIPAEEVFAELGLDFPARRPRGRRPTSPNGRLLVRVPVSVHRDLVARAAAEGVSVNQLVLAYLSRGLGQADAGWRP